MGFGEVGDGMRDVVVATAVVVRRQWKRGSVTPTFCKNNKFCANRSAYKNAYQIVFHMKNFSKKLNLV
jgi:hypothetical protein